MDIKINNINMSCINIIYTYKDYSIHIYFQVCAHRHIVKTADSQWGQGQCYILSQDLKYDDLKKPCSGKPTNKYKLYLGIYLFIYLLQNT